MKSIWKCEIQDRPVQTVKIPESADVVSLAHQDGRLFLYATCKKGFGKEPETFREVVVHIKDETDAGGPKGDTLDSAIAKAPVFEIFKRETLMSAPIQQSSSEVQFLVTVNPPGAEGTWQFFVTKE